MFQDVANYPILGAYTGFGNPFLTQHSPFQAVGNPYTGGQVMGQQSYPGIPGFTGYGAIHPQHLQLAAMMAAQQANPYLAALAQVAGLAQNPVIHSILQNPLLSHLYGSPYGQQLQAGLQGQPGGIPWGQQGGQQVNPFGQQVNPYGQQVNPYGQQGNPWGQQTIPLAPQTWVGQGGQFGQQIHPLLAQQLAARQFGIPGLGWGY